MAKKITKAVSSENASTAPKEYRKRQKRIRAMRAKKGKYEKDYPTMQTRRPDPIVQKKLAREAQRHADAGEK